MIKVPMLQRPRRRINDERQRLGHAQQIGIARHQPMGLRHQRGMHKSIIVPVAAECLLANTGRHLHPQDAGLQVVQQGLA